MTSDSAPEYVPDITEPAIEGEFYTTLRKNTKKLSGIININYHAPKAAPDVPDGTYFAHLVPVSEQYFPHLRSATQHPYIPSPEDFELARTHKHDLLNSRYNRLLTYLNKKHEKLQHTWAVLSTNISFLTGPIFTNMLKKYMLQYREHNDLMLFLQLLSSHLLQIRSLLQENQIFFNL